MRLFLMASLVISFPATAQTSEKKKSSGSKVICKSQEVTGSRVMSNRICKTKAEWDAIETRVQHEALDMQQQGVSKPAVMDRPSTRS